MKSLRAPEFDTLIVGGGLSGLLTAHLLERTGRRIVLIDSLETLGGTSRPCDTAAGPIDHGLKIWPVSAESLETLEWLEGALGERIDRSEIDAAPLNYDDGKFKPYVGFGDSRVLTAAEIEAYAVQKRLRLFSTPKDWVRKLAQTFTGTVMTQAIATKFAVDDALVIETVINGNKRISAQEVIFAAPPFQLPQLLGENAIPVRVRQKLHKGDFWTSVNIDLIHGLTVTSSEAVHVLKGANEEPSIGVFHPPQVNGLQASQWLTLIPRDQIDEEELVAGALKQIKRQIKRAYGSAFDNIAQERILVMPGSHGTLAGVFERPGRIPKIDNLWLVSALFSRQRNTVGAVMEARRIAGELGAAPTTESDRPLTRSVAAEA